MSMATSSSTIVALKSSSAQPCTKSPALTWSPISRLAVPKRKNSELSFCGVQTRLQYDARTARSPFVFCAKTDEPAAAAAPPAAEPPSSTNPMRGAMRMLLSFIIPLFSSSWGPLQAIKIKLESALQKLEDVVEAVEKVAENVDKMAENIADDLPEGKMRDLLEMVEHMAEETAKTADCLDNAIDKVQEAGERVDNIAESTGNDALSN